jgi:hypothetical protein
VTEHETTRLCPECEEEYLVEVREPGVRVPIEIYCPACGYAEDVDQESEVGDEDEATESDAEDYADIDEVSREEEEYF